MPDNSMIVPLRLRITLALSAIVLIALGTGLVFATHWMSLLYGAQESIGGNNGARMAGAAIVALGILAWIGKGFDLSVVRRVVIPVLFVWFALKSVVAWLALTGGVFKPPVALTVLLLDLVLALIYGYYLIAIRPSPR